MDELQPEAGDSVRLAAPSKIQPFYSVGIVLALFVSAVLLKRNVEPAKILVTYPCVALVTLAAVYVVQQPGMCLAGGIVGCEAAKYLAERVAGQVIVIGEAFKAPGNAVTATGDALNAALQI